MAIVSFNKKHGKGLECLFKQQNASGVPAQRAELIYNLLNHLDAAKTFNDLKLPGRRLHAHKEHKPKLWSLDVNGNFRIMFEWDEDTKSVKNVMLRDPH